MMNIFIKTTQIKINLGTEELLVLVKYKKIKHLYLRYRNNKVLVSCPFFTTRNTIETFIKKHKDWLNKVRFLKETNNSISFLKDNYYWWGVLHKKENNFSDKWLEEKAIEELKIEIAKYLPIYLAYLKDKGCFTNPEIKFRAYKSRWGSCEPHKKIIKLNTKLIEYPKACLALVLAHECVHFLSARHNNIFYEHLQNLVPNYRQTKKLLNVKTLTC